MNKIVFIIIASFLFSCSKKGSLPIEIKNNQDFFDEIGAVHAYEKDHSFVSSIEKCPYSIKASDLCSLEELPFIAQLSDDWGIEEIGQRVVVTKDWMGQRFLELLKELKDDKDLMKMFGAVTGIVISSKLSSSFYYSGNGFIYLEPDYLYLNKEELKSIQGPLDPRSGRASKLSFRKTWFYFKNNKMITNNTYDKEIKKYSLLRLLYHELAHANDFFPFYSLSDVNIDEKNLLNFSYNYKFIDSSHKTSSFEKLDSILLKRVENYINSGDVEYQIFVESLSVEDIASSFKDGSASDTYNYYNRYENFAMKLEELLMLKNHSIYRYIMFSDVEKNIDKSFSEFTFYWSQRGRILKDDILEDSLNLYQSIFPDADIYKIKKDLNTKSLKNYPEDITYKELVK